MTQHQHLGFSPEKVVETYVTAYNERDGATLYDYVFDDAVWAATYAEENGGVENSFGRMSKVIQDIGENSADRKIEFSDYQTNTLDNVAWVTVNYTVTESGTLKSNGRQILTLMQSHSGWMIATITYCETADD